MLNTIKLPTKKANVSRTIKKSDLLKSSEHKGPLQFENEFKKHIQKANQEINTEDLKDGEDCTICLFIPYKKFSYLPSNEINRIRQEASLGALKNGLFYYMSKMYGVDVNDLQNY